MSHIYLIKWQTGIMEQTFRQSMKCVTPERWLLLFFFPPGSFLSSLELRVLFAVRIVKPTHLMIMPGFALGCITLTFSKKHSAAGVYTAKQESIRNTLQTENSFTLRCCKLFTFTSLLFVPAPLCLFKPGWWYLDDSVWMHICQRCTMSLVAVMLLTFKHQVWCDGF